MKIGELNEHCGNCSLLEYCTEPFESPELCAYEELADVDETEYRRIAEGVTQEEIKDKLRQYRENNVSPWDNEHNGAICDIVLEKLYKAGEIND